MKKQEKTSINDIENIKRLAELADENKGFELGLEEDLNFDVVQVDLVDDRQNPDKSYKLYYAIEGMLRTHLPTGDSNKEIRTFIREEKIIFLTGGKKKDINGKRGADSRQAYISTHLEIALNTLFSWIQEGGNTFDLFLKFRNLNIQYGYFNEEDKSDYNQKFKKGEEKK